MKKPTFYVYVTHCIDSHEGTGQKKNIWTKVGVAFNHNDTSGLNIMITPGISVSGKLVLLEPKDKNPETDPLSWEE